MDKTSTFIESFRLENTFKIIESTVNPTLQSPALDHVSKCHI